MFRFLILTISVLFATVSPASAQVEVPTAFQEIPQICNTARNRCTPLTPMMAKGSETLATNQIAVATAPTLVVSKRIARSGVILTVVGAVNCAFGNSSVTLTGGFPLQPVAGATVTIPTTADVYAVCASATTIGFLELY